MKNDTIQRELQFSDTLVDRFAELTGNRSALHTDVNFARRTRFRERPAHGMLAVVSLAALTKLQAEPGGLWLESIKGHFREPIWTRDRLALRVEVEAAGESRRFNATWTRADHDTVLVVASGQYRPIAPATGRRSTRPTAPAIPPRSEQLDPDLETLEGHSETLRFVVDPDLLARFTSEILVPMGLERDCVVSPELLAVLMLSPMSGMHLPGRRGASLRFALDFKRAIEPGQDCALTGTARRVQLAAGHVSTDITLDAADTLTATGSLEALITDHPATMPSPDDISATHLDLGLQGRVALVVGGSRGIW